MALFEWTLDHEFAELEGRGVRFMASGRLDGIPERLHDKLLQATARTADNQQGVLNMAFNYGGRAEIVDAVRAIVADGVRADSVDENLIASHLYTTGLPDPDLIIRTAGEVRLSNFLLWQSAYSELHFTETLWPDFTAADLSSAVDAYASRQRRFGR